MKEKIEDIEPKVYFTFNFDLFKLLDHVNELKLINPIDGSLIYDIKKQYLETNAKCPINMQIEKTELYKIIREMLMHRQSSGKHIFKLTWCLIHNSLNTLNYLKEKYKNDKGRQVFYQNLLIDYIKKATEKMSVDEKHEILLRIEQEIFEKI